MERMKLDTSNLVCRLNVKNTAITRVELLQYIMHSEACDLFKVFKISASISETVQDRDVATMGD